MITVDVVVETDTGTVTVRIETANDRVPAGLTPEVATRRLIERAAGAAAYAADPPARRGVYVDPVAG